MYLAPTTEGQWFRVVVVDAVHAERADAEVRAYHVGAGYIRPANPDIQRADAEVRPLYA